MCSQSLGDREYLPLEPRDETQILWLELEVPAASPWCARDLMCADPGHCNLLVRLLDLDARSRGFIISRLVPLKPLAFGDRLWRVFRVTSVRTRLLAQQEA
jgi:hypothetical protein